MCAGLETFASAPQLRWVDYPSPCKPFRTMRDEQAIYAEPNVLQRPGDGPAAVALQRAGLHIHSFFIPHCAKGVVGHGGGVP